MTTGGEGGMVTCNDDTLWKRMSFKDHGKSFDDVHATAKKPGFRWIHHGFGTNWRLTEMQSAIGLVQLGRMDVWAERRQANADILHQHLKPHSDANGPVRLPRYRCDTVMARAVYRAAATLITGFMPSFGPTDLKVAGHATGLSLNFKIQACPACRDPVLKSTGKVPLTDTRADRKARCPWQNSLVRRASPFWFIQPLMKR